MIHNIETEVNPETMIWLGWAKNSGYRFLFHEDGDADIFSSDGSQIAVRDFSCQCTDSLCQMPCGKHCLPEIWVMQQRPCSMCGAIMELSVTNTCFGERFRQFECASCGNARSLELVSIEREAGIKSPEQTPAGRCHLAIAWLKAKRNDWYVWNLVERHPELLSTMIIALSEADEHILADRMLERFGYKAA